MEYMRLYDVLILSFAHAGAVKVMPGFGPFPFKVYSGYLNVAGPLGGAHAYDSVTIHYELHTSQNSPTDPLVTWHQGGPGGSSMYGAYTEMGYFQVDSRGNTTNPYAWNRYVPVYQAL